MQHAALEVGNGGDGTWTDDSIYYKRTLRRLEVPIQEFLHQSYVLCTVQATMANRSHNHPHP
jgi:hypothetical protein